MIMKKIRVLIVDDSMFFRKRLSEIIQTDDELEVVGEAENGEHAIQLSRMLSPDVITMDIEMPVMNGINAVSAIMNEKVTPILMLSSFTTEGAKSTLAALEAGAVDYLSKNISDIQNNYAAVAKKICHRVKEVANSNKKSNIRHQSGIGHEIAPTKTGSSLSIDDKKLIVIGASTGGPPAVQNIIEGLPANYNKPVLIIQHMPESFTGPFAERLDNKSAVRVKLAEDGEQLINGVVYIAPGGHQLTILSEDRGQITINVKRAGPESTYKPCIDNTFESIAQYIKVNVLAVILTGMGKDGTDGAKKFNKNRVTVIAQDESTSVVYGMPMMLAKAGLADYQLPINKIAEIIAGK